MNSLKATLARSESLINAVVEAISRLDSETLDSEAGFRLCWLSLEHWQSVLLLLSAGLPASAVTLVRPQFEALLRSAWIRHAASDDQLALLESDLTSDSERAAKGLPSIWGMLKELESEAFAGAPLLRRFYDRVVPGLNSFAHAGIHPVSRGASGYPEPLLISLLQSSNGIGMLTLISIGEEMGRDIREPLVALHTEYGDCLPDEEPFG